MAKQFSCRYLLLILTAAAMVVACQGEDVSPSVNGPAGSQGNSAASEVTARLNRPIAQFGSYPRTNWA